MIVKPMAHQAASLKHAEKNDRVLDLSDAGTGKTAVVIWDFVRRRKRGGGALLVLCPRSLMSTVWVNDFKKFAPTMRVGVASAAKREAVFSQDLDVYVANHDATRWLAKQKEAFFKRFGMLAIDELSFFKHHGSQRSIAARRISKHFKVRRGMTATPNSISITDVWHQAVLIDDGRRLGTEFYAFRNMICEPAQVARSAKAVNWTDKEGAEEAVFGLLQDITVRHKRENCVDIPPTQFIEYEYELPSKVRAMYETMMLHHIITPAEFGIPKTIKAQNAGIAAQKVLQICSGAVYDQDKLTVQLDAERYELVMDIAAERKRPVIFYQWLHQRDALMAQAKLRGLNYAVVDGTVKDIDRLRVFNEYQMGKLDGLIAHPDTVAHGVTLTAGTSIIWPNPIPDIELFRQGNQRQARIGQKHKTEIVLVYAKDTVEQDVYSVLRRRDAKMAHLLSLFE